MLIQGGQFSCWLNPVRLYFQSISLDLKQLFCPEQEKENGCKRRKREWASDSSRCPQQDAISVPEKQTQNSLNKGVSLWCNLKQLLTRPRCGCRWFPATNRFVWSDFENFVPIFMTLVLINEPHSSKVARSQLSVTDLVITLFTNIVVRTLLCAAKTSPFSRHTHAL